MLSIITYGIVEGLMIALVALAFQLHYSGLRLFDIGIGGIYVLASYLFISFQSFFPAVSIYIFLLLSIVSILVIIPIQFGIERFIYRPFFKRKTSGLVLLLVSLSMYTILINLISLFGSEETQMIDMGLSGESFEYGSVYLTQTQIAQGIISIVLLLSIYLILKLTILGKKITALSENLTLFQVLGFNENRTRQHILVMGAILICTASFIQTADSGIDPFSKGFHIVLLAATAVIMGGIYSYLGAIIGSLILGVVMNMTAGYLSGEWSTAATFGLLILVLLVRKDGLIHTQIRTET